MLTWPNERSREMLDRHKPKDTLTERLIRACVGLMILAMMLVSLSLAGLMLALCWMAIRWAIGL